VPFDPTPPERGRELDQAEVADETPLGTSQAFEADNADGPRPESALALEAIRRV